MSDYRPLLFQKTYLPAIYFYAISLTIITPHFANAAAFADHEQGATGSGTALAGVAAASDDISLSYWNPALLTNTNKTALYINGSYVSPDFNVSNINATDASTLYTSSNSGSDPGRSALLPSLYFATPISSKAILGISLNVPFAVSSQYDDDWAGRYYSTKNEVKDVALAFTGAYRFNDSLDLGASLQLHQSRITLETAINNFDGSSSYGQGKIDLEDDLAYGYAFGLRAKLGPRMQLGLGYRSQVTFNHTGSATFSDLSLTAQAAPYNISNTNASADNTLPDILTISVSQTINPSITLALTAMKTGWHSIQSLDINFDNEQNNSVLPLNYHDSWLYAIGLNYRYSSSLVLRGGYAIDHAPTTENNTSPIAPESDRQWFTLGGSFSFTPTNHLIFAYTQMNADKVKVDQDGQGDNLGKGEFSGDYQITVNSLSLAFSHQF